MTAPRALAILRWGAVALLLILLALDLAFPPPLPAAGDHATLVTARDGKPLRAFADAGGVWRHPATEASVSPLYIEALLAYEDRWFRHHPGVNPVALLRATWQAASSRRIVSGGSTLTMQVARILEPHRRTPLGKFRQILRALQLEAHLSKAQILALYLERAPFGGTIEGVEAASWAYLGKPAARLSHAEAALLAVLPQAPTRLRPDREPEAARRARDKVLARMASSGRWSRAEVDDARIEPVVARALQPPLSAALLAERLRARDPGATRIVSSIDAALQRTLEERLRAHVGPLPERTSAALLVVDNASMEARAYIGTAAFGDRARLGHVDMVRAWRSPGSTLKPFVYGMALDDGLVHAQSLLVDAPQSFGGYRPGNFDAAFNGPVSVADALRLSLNVPAVDILDRVGPARFAARLDHAGIGLRFPRGSRPNLALILGGTGARLEDLVGAHAALSRGGTAGRVRYTPADPVVERRLLSPGAAWIVHEVLAANPRPGERDDTFDAGRRPRVAWKTGTSYGFRDAWALGTSRRYTVGVWVGRPDGTPLPGQYGAVTALPLLFEVFDSLPRQAGDAVGLPQPATVTARAVCWPLGTAADAQPEGACQRRLDAWVLDGAVPPTLPERDVRRWGAGLERIEVDVDSGQRLGADCPAPHRRGVRHVARWPALASPWLTASERAAARLPPLAPDCADDGRAGAIAMHIEGVNDGALLLRAPGSLQGPRLALRAVGAEGEVQWLLNGRWVGATRGSQPLWREFGEPGRQQLTALAEGGAWASLAFDVARGPSD
ncbi:penicillin-binding protein 1C [Luteimonas sp. MC1750]|uniref:penicillin-binding protein 1C n=1 Tax=Luteimonas sp. MC1750 TaxID=2799326 RepID=UPI0018F06918|nr:penicillin-binding protein 1C [Luteimonas sp. MC1750]MBJ6984554.1 penicillin-binding protein 1C [Luteimonas sp. MC1750]QQO04838.1 penicillin-binding protein 1C [Luteimonas sp. MC1750]